MRILFFDTETTGLDFRKDRIIELSFILFEDGKMSLEFKLPLPI